MIKLTPEAGEEETAEEPANQILAANLKKYKIEYESTRNSRLGHSTYGICQGFEVTEQDLQLKW